jgi:hypothetical protein
LKEGEEERGEERRRREGIISIISSVRTLQGSIIDYSEDNIRSNGEQLS